MTNGGKYLHNERKKPAARGKSTVRKQPVKPKKSAAART